MNDLNVPDIIGGAQVVCYASAYNVAICKYNTEDGYYLFCCDANWKEFADTWHESIEDAQDQADYDHLGIAGNWKYK